MSASGETARERHARYRASYLPRQLVRARLKVVHLEREAKRLGLDKLFAPEDQA